MFDNYKDSIVAVIDGMMSFHQGGYTLDVLSLIRLATYMFFDLNFSHTPSVVSIEP